MLEKKIICNYIIIILIMKVLYIFESSLNQFEDSSIIKKGIDYNNLVTDIMDFFICLDFNI